MKKTILVLLLVLTLGLIACEEPHEHAFGEWLVVKEATVDEEGSKERVCSCGEKETEVIGKLEHTHEYGEWVVVKEATEEEEGSKERVCSCGEKETESIAKLEHVHNFVEGKCECGETTEVLVESIKIAGKVEMNESDEQTLVLSVLPEYATNKEVVWTSSDDSVATVVNGLVKAVKAGTVTIKATSQDGSNKEYSINITVKESSNLEALADWAFEKCVLEGMYEISLPIDLTCVVNYEGQEYSKTQKFTIRGFAFNDLSERFISQFKAGVITSSKELETNYPKYYGGSTISWSSSNVEVFDNDGNLTKPVKDTTIYLTYTVNLGNPQKSSTFVKPLLVYGMTVSEVLTLVNEYINTYVGENGSVGKDTIFPTYLDEYEADLEWQDVYGEPLKLEAYVGNPIFSKGIDVKVKVSFDGKVGYIDLHYANKVEGIEDKWDEIELFVNTIAGLPVLTFSYNLITWQDVEFGYVPFFEQSQAVIKEKILPYTYGNQRTGIKMSSVEYIVIHDTGNTSKGATAEMHDRYITNLNNDSSSTSISWHYTIDDSEIIQHLPLDEVGYHAGDGTRVFGTTWVNGTKTDCLGGGNMNGIGIETCVDNGSDYTRTMRLAAKRVAEMLIEFNLNIDRVKQHWHFSGKNCPQVIRENNRWDEFLNLVQIEYYGKTALKDVTFEWKSNSSFMDGTGRITSKQAVGTKLSYEVKVTYGGESKTYTFESSVKNR